MVNENPDLFQKDDGDFANTDPNQVDNVVSEDTDNSPEEQAEGA